MFLNYFCRWIRHVVPALCIFSLLLLYLLALSSVESSSCFSWRQQASCFHKLCPAALLSSWILFIILSCCVWLMADFILVPHCTTHPFLFFSPPAFKTRLKHPSNALTTQSSPLRQTHTHSLLQRECDGVCGMFWFALFWRCSLGQGRHGDGDSLSGNVSQKQLLMESLSWQCCGILEVFILFYFNDELLVFSPSSFMWMCPC